MSGSLASWIGYFAASRHQHQHQQASICFFFTFDRVMELGGQAKTTTSKSLGLGLGLDLRDGSGRLSSFRLSPSSVTPNLPAAENTKGTSSSTANQEANLHAFACICMGQARTHNVRPGHTRHSHPPPHPVFSLWLSACPDA